jgi:serine/threonine protein kinase/Tfp pilus assembly protein PilF
MNVHAGKAKSIFLNALEIVSVAERQAYLDAQCGSDAALRHEIGELLQHHQGLGSFLEAAARGPTATVDEPLTERPGTTIGPYKLLEQIGEGGFGVVFLAEQTQPVRRKVALKVLKPGMDTRQVVARFEAERQALALMDHPNIARVLDGGQTSSGRPYFVMDLVKGLPLTDYCDQAQLTLRERLELFVHLCQAVQHAHQKGIIHRDLKPSNVLVTVHDTTPVVKVIDFGIAKALGQSLTDKTLFTGFAQMVGTPLYMSPEQAALSNADVDTRSDIYSLGVVLYELLTGTTPFDKERLKEVSYDELRRIIREEEPHRPSTRISTLGQAATTVSAKRGSEPKRLSQLCRGELDWIVMKALEKDRNRRYESASALAADVQRYLADEPVEACPPSVGYLLGKFTRRHKRALAVGAVVGLTLLVAVGAVASAVGWAQRDRAARQASAEEEASLALIEAVRWHERGNLSEALSAAKRAEGLLAAGGSPGLRQRIAVLLADLEFLSRVGEIRLEQAHWMVRDLEGSSMDLTRAAPLYAAAFRRYGIDVQALEPHEAAAQIRQRGIRAELLAALVEWSLLIRDKGERERIFQVIQGADPEGKGLFRRWCQNALQPDRAALVRWAATGEADKLPPAPLAISGLWLLNAGCPAEAISLLRRAQQRHPADFWINHFLALAYIREKPPQADEAARFASAALAAQPRSASAFLNLGIALTGQQKLPEAVAAFHKAIELQPDFSQAHYQLGKALWLHGKDAEAATAFRDALKLKPDFAQAHVGLGLVLTAQHQLPEAVQQLERAIHYQGKNAKAYVFLGNALLQQGEVRKAMERFRKARELDPKLANASYGLGRAFVQEGKMEAAADAYRQAIAVQFDHAGAHHNLGTALRALGQLDAAVGEYRLAIKHAPDKAETHCNLAHVLALQAHDDDAAKHYFRAIALQPDNPDAEVGLGNVLFMQDQLDKATDHFRKAIQLKPAAMAYYGLGQVLEYQGEFGAALETLRQARDRLPPDDPERLRPRIAQRIKLCERLIGLDRELSDFLKGQRKPAGALEGILFAQVCVRKRLFGAAASLYEAAFTEDRRLAEDERLDHRYQAARAAASAGCGRGKDKPVPGDDQRAHYRTQALTWLRADLALANRQLKGALPQTRSALRRRLEQWLRDPFLAGLRDAAPAELSPAERQACQELWTEVEVFLVRARFPG